MSSLLSDTITAHTEALGMKLEAVTNNGHHLTSNGHHLTSNDILKLEDPVGDIAPALPPRMRHSATQSPGHNYANDVMGDHYEMIRDMSEVNRRQSPNPCGSRHGNVSHASRCRQRVASPCRDDYKDFSALRHREMISPCR